MSVRATLHISQPPENNPASDRWYASAQPMNEESAEALLAARMSGMTLQGPASVLLPAMQAMLAALEMAHEQFEDRAVHVEITDTAVAS